MYICIDGGTYRVKGFGLGDLSPYSGESEGQRIEQLIDLRSLSGLKVLMLNILQDVSMLLYTQ